MKNNNDSPALFIANDSIENAKSLTESIWRAPFRSIFRNLFKDINTVYASTMNYRLLDKFTINIFLLSFIALFILVFLNSVIQVYKYVPSTLSWRIIQPHEAIITLFIAFLSVLIPIITRWRFKTHYYWRILVTVCFTVLASLFIFVSGGSLEMHFAFFVVMAFIAIYSDWRLEIVVLVLVLIHHFVLYLVQPGWVYANSENQLSYFSYAIPVFITTVFTAILCQYHRYIVKEMMDIKETLVKDILEKNRIELRLKSKEKKYRSLVDFNLIGIIEADLDGKLFYANEAFLKIIGYTRGLEKKLNFGLKDITSPEYEIVDTKARNELLQNGESYPYEKEYIRKDGTKVSVLIGIKMIDREKGKCICFVEDITDKKKAEENLKISKEYFQALVENSSDAIGLVDASGRILYASPSTEKVIGYSAEELMGTVNKVEMHPEDKNRIQSLTPEILAHPETTHKLEYRIKDKKGNWRWLEVFIKDLRNEPSVGAVVVNYRDVTERKESENKIYSLAFYDQLTGVPNRTLFYEKLDEAFTQAKEKNKEMAILFMDIDRFKHINDTLGHMVGDLVLKEVTNRIRATLEPGYILGRLGGDEFGIILPNLSYPDEPEVLAQKIINCFELPFNIQSNEMYINTSIGIAKYPVNTKDLDFLVIYADMAMYQAKIVTGSSYRAFTPDMSESYLARLKIERNLRRALIKSEFTLNYQPKLAIESGKIIGMEALIRWNNKELGNVSPTQFIAVAEEIGMIDTIGEWVLKTACVDTARLHLEGFTNLCVSVNVSVKQFRSNIVGIVRKVLSDTGLDATYLELELTESDIMRDDIILKNSLRELKEMGVSISIDDFGTGYSSLSRITRLPIDILKIDKSFISNVNKELNNSAIVKAIIAMADSLKLEVIAEGVENQDEFDFLKDNKCNYIQGYFVSPPLPFENFEKFVKNN